MSYAAAQDMINQFGERELIELTDHSDAGVIDLTVLGRVLDRATGEINPAVRAAGLTPGVQDFLLRDIACDIARYHLYEDSEFEPAERRYKEAQRKLQLIAKREMRLEADLDSQGTAGMPEYAAPAQVFSRDALKDY